MKFERNTRSLIWSLAFLTALCWSIPALMIFALIPQPQKDWTWPKFAVLSVIIYAIWLWCSTEMVLQFRTRFTEEGIIRPTWRGTRFLAWRDVERATIKHLNRRGAKSGPLCLYFYAYDSDYWQIPLTLFRNPAEVVAAIERHLPASTRRDFSLAPRSNP